MSIDDFKRDVYALDTLNGKQITKLTGTAKTLKDSAIFLVEIVVNSIKEVRMMMSNCFLVYS
jgi:hypothetical protein